MHKKVHISFWVFSSFQIIYLILVKNARTRNISIAFSGLKEYRQTENFSLRLMHYPGSTTRQVFLDTGELYFKKNRSLKYDICDCNLHLVFRNNYWVVKINFSDHSECRIKSSNSQ